MSTRQVIIITLWSRHSLHIIYGTFSAIETIIIISKSRICEIDKMWYQLNGQLLLGFVIKINWIFSWRKGPPCYIMINIIFCWHYLSEYCTISMCSVTKIWLSASVISEILKISHTGRNDFVFSSIYHILKQLSLDVYNIPSIFQSKGKGLKIKIELFYEKY